MKFDLIRLALLPATLLACTATLRAAEVTVTAPESPMLRFALGKLEAALQRQAATVKRTMNQAPEHGAEIVVSVDPTTMTDIGAEGFRRVNSRQGLKITGGDERGGCGVDEIHPMPAWHHVRRRVRLTAALIGIQMRFLALMPDQLFGIALV